MTTTCLRVLSLFAGIGGLDLGLENTGGFRTVAFCEIDPYARQVLAKHWPGVPCYDDVRTLTADRLAADGNTVDVICGGFPCQDISYAGSGTGINGARSGLWREFTRLIGEVGPRYVIMENVAALLDRGLGALLGALSDLGYDAEWSLVSSCSLGATHVRQRLFLVAYPDGQHVRLRIWNPDAQQDRAIQASHGYQGARASALARMANPSALYRDADGVSFGMDRNRVIGNAADPKISEMIGRAILRSIAVK